MRFSIVVPIYGVEPYIRECLNSILYQTFSDYEVILVDDGSKDNCPSICDEYVAKDVRFKVIHKSNGGLVSARQAGVEIASGDYIICIDGDDWVSPNYLEHFSAIIDEFSPDILVCDSIYAYPDKNIETHNSLRKGLYCKEDLEKGIYTRLVYGNQKCKVFPSQLWAKAFKRVIYYQQQLVNVVVNMGEDRACVIPILYHSDSMYVSDLCGYYYRQIPTSMTKAKKPFRVDGPRLIYEHLENQLDLDKFDFANQLYQSTCHSLFNVCKSQFYGNDGYWKTRNRIAGILNDSVYKECIKNAKFNDSFLRKMMQLALKYRLYFLMFIYSKFS